MKHLLTLAALTLIGLASVVAEAATPAAAAKPKKVSNIGICGVHGSSRIYLSARHSLPEYTAAAELQKAFNAIRLYGGNAEIAPMDDELPQGRACGIIIGDLDSPIIQKLADRLKLKKSADDEIAQYVIDGNLILAGNSPRAAMYSVFDFMQRHMGVRWLWPGEGGTFYTREGVSVPADLAYNYKPSFRFRVMSAPGKGPEATLFGVLNGNHDSAFQFGGERVTGGEAIQPARSDFKDHPEWFAVREVTKKWLEENPTLGKMPENHGDKVNVRYLPPPTGWCWIINGCWSNQEFTNKCIERIKGYIRDGRSNHVSIHPADSMARCICEKCKAMIDPDLSSRWFRYHAGLVRELKKEYPNLRYSVLAYQEYREVPAIPVEEVEFVEYCNYSRCFVHKINDPNCGTNKEDFRRFDGWINHQKGKKVPVGLWDYTYDVFNPMYALPVYAYFADLIQYCAKNDIVKLFFENGDGAKRSRLATWVADRMMWDASLDPEKLVNDYCATAYGPAAKIMAAYHRACAKAWDTMPAHLTSCFNNPGGTAKIYLSNELIELSKKAFADADAAIKAVKVDHKNKVVTERNTKRRDKQLAAVDFERGEFNRWLELHEKMMKNSVMLPAFKGTGNDDFQEAAQTINTFKGRDGKVSSSVTGQIYWTDNDLMIRITADDPDFKPKEYQKKADGNGAWGSRSIELFIQPNGLPTYYHLAAGANGDFYDGEAMNGKWNGEWNVSRQLDGSKWTLTFQIPFKTLGKVPANGETWKIVMICNGAPVSVGIPYPAHHDIGAGAELTFNGGKRP